jgi:hypothetical protein
MSVFSPRLDTEDVTITAPSNGMHHLPFLFLDVAHICRSSKRTVAAIVAKPLRSPLRSERPRLVRGCAENRGAHHRHPLVDADTPTVSQ